MHMTMGMIMNMIMVKREPMIIHMKRPKKEVMPIIMDLGVEDIITVTII
jgi:hypothetical protein